MDGERFGFFCFGAVACLLALLAMAKVSSDAEKSTCQKQHWIGEACQCKALIFDYDKRTN